MGVFRALVAAGEVGTPRALALSAEVIALNAANYTAW
jgi:hypothetical protein